MTTEYIISEELHGILVDVMLAHNDVIEYASFASTTMGELAQPHERRSIALQELCDALTGYDPGRFTLLESAPSGEDSPVTDVSGLDEISPIDFLVAFFGQREL